MVSVVRISALSWADMLAGFVMYVMMNYLTDVWNLSTIHAAGILNIWNGITQVLPIVFTFFVDAFMGDYYMLVVSSISYTIGLGFLFMSTPPIFGPCSEYKEECIGHTQKVLFFTALAFIAVGVAGLGVSLQPFIDLQNKKNAIEEEKEKDENEGATEEEKEKGENAGATEEEKEKEENMPLCQTIGLLIVAIVGPAGVIGLPYIKPWSIRFSIASICTLATTLLFLSGCRGYKCSKPEGSPFTTILRVFIASVRNKSQPLPGRTQLYNDDSSGYTSNLRCLDKAAIKLHGEQQEVKSWKLCSVGEVEETKIHIRIIPMWLTFIVIGTVLSVGNTYFLEQANKMDRRLGKIKIPTEFFLVPFSLASLTSKLAFRIMRGCLPTKRALPIGMALTMVYSVICCIIAAKVETRRLHVIRDHGLLEKPDERIPMSIFWLVPQFLVLGWVQGTASVSITCFFKQKAPESMLKYLVHIIMGVQGLGTMASVLMVHIVGKVSHRNQKRNWFQSTLNESHLDRYYWTLAAISAANLLLHIIISRFYKYKNDPLPVRKVKQVRGDKSDPRQMVNRVVLESIKSNGG